MILKPYTVSGDGSHEHNNDLVVLIENAVFDEMRDYVLMKSVLYWLISPLRKLQI
jgi:hypothetical protein